MTTGHRIQFTSASKLDQNGVIQVKMPASLTLQAVGSTVEIVPNDKMMSARTGTVLVGQVIEITEIFKGVTPVPNAPYNFDFWINSSKNQNTALDAGAWAVNTFERI